MMDKIIEKFKLNLVSKIALNFYVINIRFYLNFEHNLASKLIVISNICCPNIVNIA